jgi:hypothetical protein
VSNFAKFNVRYYLNFMGILSVNNAYVNFLENYGASIFTIFQYKRNPKLHIAHF